MTFFYSLVVVLAALLDDRFRQECNAIIGKKKIFRVPQEFYASFLFFLFDVSAKPKIGSPFFNKAGYAMVGPSTPFTKRTAARAIFKPIGVSGSNNTTDAP
mmetsp:Transcript_1052/g.2334  ORF Transcript_1052/g.2334 Transcript_1052/m.2334 type:complete len:101 (+) Transcript_1052:219-521(+)